MTSEQFINIQETCALIPAFNEARFIGKVVERLLPIVPNVFVIDDGSTDETAATAERHGAAVIGVSANLGKGNAIRVGLQEALVRGFSYLLLLDGDLQHLPEESAGFLDVAAKTDAAIVIGNRFKNSDGMPLLRRLTNRFMSWLVSRMCRQNIPDTQCGFRLIRSDAAKAVLSDCSSCGFDLESEMLFTAAKRGFRIETTPISTRYGAEQSKIHKGRDTIRFFELVWRYRDLLAPQAARRITAQSTPNNRERLAETRT